MKSKVVVVVVASVSEGAIQVETLLTKEIKRQIRLFRPALSSSLRTIRWAEEVRIDTELYGACVRTAKAMGYHKVITYILESENGLSLKASNFICEGIAGAEIWTGSRKRDNGVPREKKTRWAYEIRA